MGTLKVEGDDKVIERFKRKARREYGEKRGSIKKATMNLIEDWVEEQETEWGNLRGSVSSHKSSVELEKNAWKKVD